MCMEVGLDAVLAWRGGISRSERLLSLGPLVDLDHLSFPQPLELDVDISAGGELELAGASWSCEPDAMLGGSGASDEVYPGMSRKLSDRKSSNYQRDFVRTSSARTVVVEGPVNSINNGSDHPA